MILKPLCTIINLMRLIITLLLLIPSLSWGLGENIKNNKDVIKEEIQNKVEGVGSHNNNSSVSSANKELIGQFKNNFTTIEELEEALTSAVKEQGKEKLIEDIQTTIEKKVIVAENLYKKLNENDLKEITNLLISLRVLDKTSYLSLFDLTSQAKWRLGSELPIILKTLFPMGIPCVEVPAYLCEGGDCVDICTYVR